MAWATGWPPKAEINVRTLAFKLTVAFLFVGTLGVILVALFVAQRTQAGFNQFLSDSYAQSLATSLVVYYEENGSWDQASQQLLREYKPDPRPPERFVPWALVDPEGYVILGDGRYPPGELLDSRTLSQATPLIVNGETVGQLVQLPIDMSGEVRLSPEAVFLGNVNTAILVSSLVAVAAALFVGVLLARTIAGPIRDLTHATTAVAQGELGLQVDVHSQDEIGELAVSFNQMSRDLALASRQRRQMTADIAHELRTPLSIILGYTESLRDGILPPDTETFDILHDEAQHLNRLVQDLRTLSLAEAGELSLSMDVVAPTDLLRVVAAKYAHHADQQGVALRIAPEPGLPDIEVDPGRMEQVLGNLVSNALRYTPSGGHILLTAAQTGVDKMTLLVADTGEGILPQDLDRVFDRFYKADPSRAAQNGESGLGLAIVRSLVTMHGGTISVDSTVGTGTTFRIELPIQGKEASNE